jgi:hypothetical protein
MTPEVESVRFAADRRRALPWTWLDAVGLLAPGALTVWAVWASRDTSPATVWMTLYASFYAGYVIGYVLGAVAARTTSSLVVGLPCFVLAVLSALVGGMSMGAGWYVFIVITAPCLGACVASLLTRHVIETSPAR